MPIEMANYTKLGQNYMCILAREKGTIFLEYKILEENEIELLADFCDDENTKYNKIDVLNFINDENQLAFIAKKENKIIGFAYGYLQKRPDGKIMFYLYAIDIEKKYQGNGYGTNLMNFIKEYVKSIGCYKMYLSTNKSNISACKCYEKIGCKINAQDDVIFVCKF